jgi:methionyl-tRNA formyltransferase
MGKGALAIRVAGWFLDSPDHQLHRVVPVIPEPTWTESLSNWAAGHGVPVVASGDYRDIGDDDERLDLVVSVFYDRIVRSDFIARCGRIINLHNGPLPRYRGVAPINWALKNGERSHGVTIHEMTAGVDAGPILAQVIYPIDPELDEVRDVYARSLECGWTLFRETIPNLGRIQPRPQDEADATYYSARDMERLGDRRSFTRAESVAG